LQDVRVSPHIAVMLMVVSEHLDYHATFLEYCEAKQRILGFQQSGDWAVVYQDGPSSPYFTAAVQGQLWPVSAGVITERGTKIERDGVSVVEHGIAQPVISLADVPLRGVHNLQNIAAAVSVGTICGLVLDNMRQALCRYQPLPHRLELVATHRGISYYNDSFATTPETTMAALASFTEATVLILGGSDKGSNFDALVVVMQKNTALRGVVVIGAIAAQIKQTIDRLGGLGVPIIDGCDTMTEIVHQASALLDPQDRPAIVLLSPGAASFGLFKDYKDRGLQFAKVARDMEHVR
jgi:UDP-N-acetylmuramoylalanine--D-glutamate ligase